jgi:hypothetical protein
MTIKEIFHLSDILHKIKLDKSENNPTTFQSIEKFIEEKSEDVKFSANEWDQEYELIYAAYILER